MYDVLLEDRQTDQQPTNRPGYILFLGYLFIYYSCPQFHFSYNHFPFHGRKKENTLAEQYFKQENYFIDLCTVKSAV